MNQVYNFAAGPAALPQEVLKQAQADLLSYNGCGYSVMEMTHRGPLFEDIIGRAEASLRSLLGLGEDYSVLFLHGGATMQFSMVPLNLMNGSNRADYIQSGMFAQKAAEEAARYGTVNIPASSKEEKYARVPILDEAKLDSQADYLHITTNNTIFGTQFNTLPNSKGVPLVADMSSNILGMQYDFSRFSLIYAGAQKNIGPAGTTLVVIKKSLLGKARAETPVLLNYQTQAKDASMYNTPCCWAIYIAGLVFAWVLKQGGVAEMERRNREKAALLYDCIDASGLYEGVAHPASRSIMNVTFRLKDDGKTDAFVKYAAQRGLVNLKGHRSTGGVRASIYNAMPKEGVLALVECMKDFERNL